MLELVLVMLGLLQTVWLQVVMLMEVQLPSLLLVVGLVERCGRGQCWTC